MCSEGRVYFEPESAFCLLSYVVGDLSSWQGQSLECSKCGCAFKLSVFSPDKPILFL